MRLTTAIRSNVSGSNNFRYINHTWRHWDNDIHGECAALPPGWQDEDRRDAALCERKSRPNQTAWQKLGLPQQNAEQRHHGPRRPLRLEGRRL